jgi:hypothetical protein
MNSGQVSQRLGFRAGHSNPIGNESLCSRSRSSLLAERKICLAAAPNPLNAGPIRVGLHGDRRARPAGMSLQCAAAQSFPMRCRTWLMDCASHALTHALTYAHAPITRQYLVQRDRLESPTSSFPFWTHQAAVRQPNLRGNQCHDTAISQLLPSSGGGAVMEALGWIF